MTRQRLAVIADSLKSDSASQRMLDRFLIGHALTDGGFRKRPIAEVVISGGAGADRDRRVADHQLLIADDISAAVADASAIFISQRADLQACPAVTAQVLAGAQAGSSVFVHGTLASDAKTALQLLAEAATKKIRLVGGTHAGSTWRLPAVEIPNGIRLDEALIVMPGMATPSEGLALDALLGLIEGRELKQGPVAFGEAGVVQVIARTGAALWAALEAEPSTRALLAAALARSDSPLGDAVVDGRTQDLLGLGLLPKLARNPVGYFLSHADKLQSTILMMDGVVGDLNFALRTRSRAILSAQLYQGPQPGVNHLCRLAEIVSPFLCGGPVPWPSSRAALVAGLLDDCQRALAHPNQRIETKLERF